VPTPDDVVRPLREERLARLAGEPGALAARLDGPGDTALGRRPGPGPRAPTEVVCLPRDTDDHLRPLARAPRGGP
jgi:hypothetical protein